MKKHPTDLFALLFGLAFAIAGVAVIVSQASSSDISPRGIAATGLILLGVVALTATLLRTRHDTVHQHAFSPFDGTATDEEPVSPEDPAG